MSSKHNSVEDIESTSADHDPDAEFQRIKGNYRVSVVLPDLPDTQDAFRELQTELQEFLTDYIPKVASLHDALMASSNTLTNAGNGGGDGQQREVGNRASRVARTSMLIPAAPQQKEDLESPQTLPDALSEQANCNQDPATSGPARYSSMGHRKTPLDTHMQALQSFLAAHMENVKNLQLSMGTLGTVTESVSRHGPLMKVVPQTSQPPPIAIHEGDRQDDLVAQRLHAVVAISTMTAVFALALIILSYIILAGQKQTAFNVGMLFAFFALSFHFGIIVIGARGSRQIVEQSLSIEKHKHEPAYFRFYLTLCEQLHFCATLFLMVATLIMAFLIFSSLAFPLVLLFLSALGAIVVFVSASFKVLITVDNLTFLAKNVRRLGWRSLDYVQTNVNTRRQTHA